MHDEESLLHIHDLYLQGRHDLVLKLALPRLEIDPNDAAAHSYCGFAYCSLNKLDLAEQHAKTRLHLDPDTSPPYELLSKIEEKKGNPKKALQHARVALERTPDQAHYHFWLGCLLLKHASLEAAHAAFFEACTLDPATPEYVAYHLFSRPFETNDPATIKRSVRSRIKKLETLLAQHPENLAIHTLLGCLNQIQTVDPKKAKEHMETALRLQPGNVALQKGHTRILANRSLLYRTLSLPFRSARLLFKGFRSASWKTRLDPRMLFAIGFTLLDILVAGLLFLPLLWSLTPLFRLTKRLPYDGKKAPQMLSFISAALLQGGVWWALAAATNQPFLLVAALARIFIAVRCGVRHEADK